MKTIIKLISTGFYLGYSPIASGTVGSLLGVLIYLVFREFIYVYIAVTVLLFILGFLVSQKAEEIFDEKDSGKIVIDEIASMCLVYIFIKPTWFMLGFGFLLFRVFDVMKPYPAKRLEKLSGSKGIMLDDVVAACYAILGVVILNLFLEAGVFSFGDKVIS